eukprot:5209740-Pyramimonas_sp.AAC.1
MPSPSGRRSPIQRPQEAVGHGGPIHLASRRLRSIARCAAAKSCKRSGKKIGDAMKRLAMGCIPSRLSIALRR